MLLLKKHKKTIINFFWQAAQIFGRQGYSFIVFYVASMLLLPDQFGEYNYLLSIIFLLVAISDFGISSAVTRYVSEYEEEGGEKNLIVLWNVGFVVGLLTIVILIALKYFGENFFDSVQVAYLFYGSPLIFLVTMVSVFDGFYRARNKFKKFALILLTSSLVSLPLVYLLIEQFGILGALISQSVYYLIIFIISVASTKLRRVKFSKAIIRDLFSYSALLGVVAVGNFLYTRVDILFLGHFGLFLEISQYEIITRFIQLIVMPSMILAQVVAPNYTRRFYKKQYSLIRKKIIMQSLYLFIFGLVISVVFYYLSPFVLKNFFSEYQFEDLSYILMLLLLLVPFYYSSKYVNIGCVTPGGRAKFLVYTVLGFGLLNVVLNYVFINIFGFYGVIYATLITHFLTIVVNYSIFIILINRLSKNREIS